MAYLPQVIQKDLDEHAFGLDYDIVFQPQLVSIKVGLAPGLAGLSKEARTPELLDAAFHDDN